MIFFARVWYFNGGLSLHMFCYFLWIFNIFCAFGIFSVRRNRTVVLLCGFHLTTLYQKTWKIGCSKIEFLLSLTNYVISMEFCGSNFRHLSLEGKTENAMRRNCFFKLLFSRPFSHFLSVIAFISLCSNFRHVFNQFIIRIIGTKSRSEELPY